MDMLEGAIDNDMQHADSEGSLFVGNHAVRHEGGGVLLGGWLWTEDTGSVSLRKIINENDGIQSIDNWFRQVSDISSDGMKILFTGWTIVPNGQLTQYRAGVLRLIPKASEDAIHQLQGVVWREEN